MTKRSSCGHDGPVPDNQDLTVGARTMPADAMSTREAAAALGVSVSHVSYLVRRGHIGGEKAGQAWRLEPASVAEHAARCRDSEQRWVSIAEAARIVGCGPGAVTEAADRGDIVQRNGLPRGLPSLELDSVRSYATTRAHQLGAAAGARAAAAAERRSRNGPPDDGDVWLSPATVGLMLGISRSRVLQLARAGRLPAERVGTRWWVRRLHAEQVVAARVARRREPSS